MTAPSGLRKVALITGVTGQDGAYLAEFLIGKGYLVHGVKRRSSSFNTGRIERLYQDPHAADPNFILHYGDMSDATNLVRIVQETRPDEIYNLAAQSFVQASFVQPDLTGETTGLGALRMLEATRAYAPDARFYQAASSEMFGRVVQEPQNETTPFHPRSPYGVAKAYAYWAAVNYREAYSMFASNGILFNHESPRRGIEFVTRKISVAVARIALGKARQLALGTLDAARDWGYAPDYVELMWRVLQHPEADDFVGATGESHTVREFVEEAFRVAGVENWSKYVVTDARFTRPSEVNNLRGDASKAAKKLGWTPTTRFKDLVRLMVEADLKGQRG